METVLKAKISTPTRIQSVDLLRGAVMIIMAIDHVRVYSGMPAGGIAAGIFFTRWITHYCAPAFAFFAGTSAFLYYQKSASRSDVVRFLITRGLLLVILELTIVRFFWTFNFNYDLLTLTGVIWMLGWCMIILAAFVHLKPSTIAVTGLVIIFIQQVFTFVPRIFPSSIQESVAVFWGFFYPVSSPGVTFGSSGLPHAFGLDIFYVVIPWIGVMMAGYGFGQLLLKEPVVVKKYCLRIGLTAIVLFILVGTTLIVTDVNGTDERPFIFKLLGQQKYPPSQLFLLMTLGPVIALVPWAQKLKGSIAEVTKIIGRVPMFFYLMHLLLIHTSAYVVNFILYGTIHQDWYDTAPFVGIAEPQRWGLPILYLVWVIDIVVLYFLCRWYAGYKAAHPEIKWMKYL
jgi:uncharacterized membrane protein